MELVEHYTIYERKIINSLSIYGSNSKRSTYSVADNLQRRKKNNGNMSKYSKKLIDKRLTAWLTCVKIASKYGTRLHRAKNVYLIFVTLTLASTQSFTDKEVKKKLLEPFLKRLKYNESFYHYFWRCEKEKNERLHIHLIFDKYIPGAKIRMIWNDIQEKNGCLDEFYNKFGHRNPPSTHVTKLKLFKFPISYVMKYVTKSSSTQTVSGALYRFSRSLLKLKPYSFIPTSQYLPNLTSLLNKYVSRSYSSDWFDIFDINKVDFFELFDEQIKKSFINYYLDVFERLYFFDVKRSQTKPEKHDDFSNIQQTPFQLTIPF